MDFKSKIRNIPDFPEKGIIFRDIGPLIEDKVAFKQAMDELENKLNGIKIDKIVGIDARGFVFASILADRLGAGLVMARKKGKLPSETVSESFDIEYAQRELEIHKDSIDPGEKVLLVDDVLATGGTMRATANLVEKVSGDIVGALFLIILDYLPGREKLKDIPLYSLINYES